MTNGSKTITDDMLHAFVDGHLSDADMAHVESWLNANPDRAEEIMDWAEQNRSIEALFPEVPVNSVEAPSANTNAAPLRYAAQFVAGLAVLAVGIFAGWTLRDSNDIAQLPTNDTEIIAALVQDALAAHVVYAVDPHRPVEIKASQEALLIRWLSNRVGAQMVAPNLESSGFDLVGGRLLSVSEGPAAQFMYENLAGTRITLMVLQGNTGRMAEFQFENDGEANSFYWQDETLRYALVGDIPRGELSEIASNVFNQLTAG
ncbi:anti-sigma factor family protein [Halocynthiibacter namhaensis]|uniref:anti-sigma factor family protein n=1 Tax=Halocynthiibacter namhaensis TaxID=1290553 RepID=UPI0005799E49|nr:anti-sigma factor [Halocynthiibacter namhaensis]